MMKINFPAYNIQDRIYDILREDGRPIIVYGAGETAAKLTELLNQNDLDIYAYAVDVLYYQPGVSFFGKAVMCYADVLEHCDDVILLLGIGCSVDTGAAFLNDSRGTRYVCTRFYGNFAPMSRAFVEEHRAALEETYGWLSDDLSRWTMEAYIHLKLSGDARCNLDVACGEQYFNGITGMYRGGTFIDCGAYTGDTVMKFAEWSQGNYEWIYALEPDPDNFVKMKAAVGDNPRIRLSCLGAWDTCDTLMFSADEMSSSALVTDGGIEIAVDALDHVVGRQEVSFIKMDIEGAEMRALHGAEGIIRTWHPVLAIAVYHKSEDLFTIPQYIRSFDTAVCRYRFYLRKHHIADELELILYAIPEVNE